MRKLNFFKEMVSEYQAKVDKLKPKPGPKSEIPPDHFKAIQDIIKDELGKDREHLIQQAVHQYRQKHQLTPDKFKYFPVNKEIQKVKKTLNLDQV